MIFQYILILPKSLIAMTKKRYKIIGLFHLRFLFLCILAGIGSGYFTLITNQAYFYFKQLYQYSPYSIFIWTPTVFCLIAFLFKHYFPYAGGSGLSQGYALDAFAQYELKNTYSIKTMFGKILLTLGSIGSGASLGREGPSIQICSAIFGSMKGLSLKHKKLFIRLGSGIGVATAFNAPLGGIIFVLEEYLKVSRIEINNLLLLGIIIAGYTGTLIYGDYSYMGRVPTSLLTYHWQTIVLSIIAGIICGLAGAALTRFIVYFTVNQGQFWYAFSRKHYLCLAIFFGFCVALLGFLSDGASFGNGAVEVKYVLDNGLSLPWHYGLTKSLGTLFSIAANAPGGYFSTALSIGAGLMDTVHRLWPILPVEQFYLLGMVGFLAAITNAPITAVAMMLSIVIDSQYFLLPMILSSLTASYLANLFGDSVYHQQVLIYIDKQKYRQTR